MNFLHRILLSDIDVLCHGSWGTVELLLFYYQNIEKSTEILRYLTQIKTFLFNKINENKIKCNVRNNLFSIGFMTGLTGIAYEMMRLEYPELIPSVLLLEQPKFEI